MCLLVGGQQKFSQEKFRHGPIRPIFGLAVRHLCRFCALLTGHLAIYRKNMFFRRLLKGRQQIINNNHVAMWPLEQYSL